MRKRRWHSVRRDGPGRMRIRVAEMLKTDCGIDADPYDISCLSDPNSRLMDLCRWCVDGKREGQFVHVCSWDRMTDIIKAGCLAVVEDDPHHFEVCRRGSAKKGK